MSGRQNAAQRETGRFSVFGKSHTRHPGLILRLSAVVFDLTSWLFLAMLALLIFDDASFSLALLVALYMVGHIAGWTPGNAVAGIRVVGPHHGAPGLAHGFLRFLASLLTLSTGGLGYLTILSTPRRQALHDVLSKTQVVVVSPEDSRRWGLPGWFLSLIMVLLMIGIAIPDDATLARPNAGHVSAELRLTAVALESYYIANDQYPLPDLEGWVAVASVGPATGFTPRSLTTPIAYLSALHDDPFRRGRQSRRVIESFAYYYATHPGTCWILASAGPDRILEADLLAYVDPDQCNCDPNRFYAHLGGLAVIYDPTNGSMSSGDIFRTGP